MTMPAQFPALQQRGLAKFIKLALDFSANETLDPRITFSRTSNATRVNAQGLIEYAPHNLFDNSENLLNWTLGSGASITANAAISPNNTATADLVAGATSLGWNNTNSIARQPAATLIPSTTYYGSIYVKAETATTVTLQLRDQSTGSTQQTTVTLTGSWQRISANITLGSATTAIGFVLGNADGTFYAWGGQLNIGSLQPYYTTSVKNLLGYSQNFENAAWAKSNSTIDATPVMGPLGFLGAEKLVESAVAGQHYILQNISIGANGKYTASIYAKKAEKTKLTIWLLNAATADRAAVSVNLIDGTYVSAGAGGAPFIDISVNVVNVGDGWFRCGISATTTGGAISLQARYFGNDGSSYTGDGISGIYIFGAQLSDSASLDPYSYNFGAAPTSSAYYGPRFDYDPVTLAPKGLLIEEQRINILLNSDTLSTQSVSVTAQAYTLSFYGTGSVALSGAYTGSLVGTGVYPNQVQLTFTPAIGTLTLTVTGSVRYANLEAGSFPTSYIPTTSASVTRAADNASMVGTNFSSWYNQSEGTLFAESDTFYTGSGYSNSIVRISDNTDFNAHYISINGNKFQTRTFANASLDVDLNSSFAYSINTFYKTSYAYKINDFAAYLPNVLLTDTAGNVPLNLNRLDIGRVYWGGVFLNGHIKSLKYFNKRLQNAILQRLTQ